MNYFDRKVQGDSGEMIDRAQMDTVTKIQTRERATKRVQRRRRKTAMGAEPAHATE